MAETPSLRDTPDGGRNRDRLLDRASERARTLHAMRGGLLTAVSIIAGGSVLFSAGWLALAVTDNEPAARTFGIISLILGMLMNVVVLFLAWMTLEALGRIERETDRVQAFMDNVYRRLP